MAPTYIHSGSSTFHSTVAFILSNTLLASIATFIFLPYFFYGARGMLYIWVPYFTVNKIMALSLNDGWQVQIFASHFPPLYYLRKHIGLTAEAPKKLREADGQFILAMFPHGTGSDFRVLLQGMLPELFPHFHDKIRSLAASVLFLIPFIRELTLLTGCIEASRHVADKAIKNGRTILVLPGGESEQLLTKRGVEKVYLLKRKGFVKLALKHNIPLVPAYVFGSSDLYETSTFLFDARWKLMKAAGVCLPFCSGYLGSLCPFPVKNTIVFGEPITLPKTNGGEVTEQALNSAHELFIKKLTELFDKNKKKYGCGDKELIIV